MELSYDSSEWVSDEDSHQSIRLAVNKPKPKRMCQVPGCPADLEAIGKPYCRVKRICPIHMKADVIPVHNQIMRFCQQCGVLEPLSLFDYSKRSCRDSLSRRVKHPADSETRPKRKRKPQQDSDAGSHSGYWPQSVAWTPAGSASAGAAAPLRSLSEASWDAAYTAAAGPLPVSNVANAAGDAAAWNSAAAGVMIPSSCWLEVPAAEQPAAAAYDGSSPAGLVSPASSTCTAAAAVAAAAAGALYNGAGVAVGAPYNGAGVAAGAPYNGAGVAVFTIPCSTGGCSTVSTFPMQRQGSLPQQQCSPQSMQAAAGINSPLSGSNGSNEFVDPAVLELEQFMMQELAAAGVVVNDSSSSTPLPAVMVPVAAAAPPMPQQPMWHHVPMHQQQQQVPDVNPVIQYQPMQPHQPTPPQMQPPMQQQTCHAQAAPHRHCDEAAAGSPSDMTACYTPGPAAPAAAVGVWVPAGACGSNMPSPNAAAAPQHQQPPQQQQQQGMMRASPGPAPGCGGSAAAAAVSGRGVSSRSEMMARLQGRLHVLQSQMEDMQLMLGMLQGGCA